MLYKRYIYRKKFIEMSLQYLKSIIKPQNEKQEVKLSKNVVRRKITLQIDTNYEANEFESTCENQENDFFKMYDHDGKNIMTIKLVDDTWFKCEDVLY